MIGRDLRHGSFKLVPALGNYLRGEPRSIAVLDNASIHTSYRVVDLIEDAGAVCVFQSAYSPDLNPIEKFFRQYKCALKRRLRLLKTDPFAAHKLALTTVTKKNMVKYYRAVGTIQNVPEDEEENIATVVATTLLATTTMSLLLIALTTIYA